MWVWVCGVGVVYMDGADLDVGDLLHRVPPPPKHAVRARGDFGRNGERPPLKENKGARRGKKFECVQLQKSCREGVLVTWGPGGKGGGGGGGFGPPRPHPTQGLINKGGGRPSH